MSNGRNIVDPGRSADGDFLLCAGPWRLAILQVRFASPQLEASS